MFQAAYKELDVDGDGKVGVDEYQIGDMKNLDIDKSGDISFAEFCFSLYQDKGRQGGEIKQGIFGLLSRIRT